ncbi:MAG TPA: non-canonical purine NTP pyrophosphatase [Peptococcaceae bacterium]|nr:non-canonical purine NTP pyrophosphatase [Peptococcaceae bacterium]
MKKIVIASRNPGKIAEFRQLLAELPLEVLSLLDFPEIPEILESGLTFRENALLKARTVTSYTGLTALADDSGLEVDYLGGAPGVYSARYAGPECDDAANNQKLLAELAGVPLEKRTARFRCVIAITTPRGEEFFCEGVCEGKIGYTPRGESGFGYDPLFIVPALGKTFAELGPEVKNRISHRAQAMRLAREILERLVGTNGEGKKDANRGPE